MTPIELKRGFIFYILFFQFSSIIGQEPQLTCDLNILENEYNVGRFDEVNTRLRACLETLKKNEILYQDGLRLLAMNSIMMDSMDLAIADVNALLDFNSDYNFRSNDPYIFRELVKKYKNYGGITVTSVSKFEETLEETPATIFVLTQEQIKNRGYLDIEQIFHDIPGFSIAKGNGPAYSLLYPRGYRTTLNDKFLLLVDGIEENDLNSDNAVFNRQIALSNIKQIEVIYGPSSTMYGANAFSAVINIITKDALFKEDKKFSADIQTNFGSWDTNFVDATVSRKIKDGYFTVTGRLFQSSEMDLTDNGYNYDPNSYDYLNAFPALTGDEAQTFINQNGSTSNFFDYDLSAANPTVALNQTGADQMKAIDQSFYEENPGLGFNNSVKNWFFNTKLKIENFTLGLESYKTNAGAIPWYPRNTRIASEELSRWITNNNSIFVKYEKKINQRLLITNLASYRLHNLDGATNLSRANTFNTAQLGLQNLIDLTPPSISSAYYYRSSNQLRNELKLFYKKNKFNLITGLEIRQGIFQLNYLQNSEAFPDETAPATTPIGTTGGNNSNKLDFGFYTQGKYSITNSLALTLGGRVDYNRLRTNGGFGFVFNPRAALVFSKEKFTFKTIYSEAFKDASFLTKYATTDTRIANPGLEPEKVKNIEFSMILKPIKNFYFEVNAYSSIYSNIVSEISVGNGLTQNQTSIEGNNIKGLQANLNYAHKAFDFWANYTFTEPLDESVDLRISDIPSHSTNAGFNVKLLKKLNVNFRANYVGIRKTGQNTAGSSNPLNEVESYLTLHSNVNLELFKGLNIGILINNLLDEEFYHPGIRTANNITSSSVFLQNKRGIMLRTNFNF